MGTVGEKMVQVLRGSGKEMTADELAQEVGVSEGHARRELGRLVKRGEIFSRYGKGYSVTESVIDLYDLVYDNPMSIAELTRHLGVSRPAVRAAIARDSRIQFKAGVGAYVLPKKKYDEVVHYLVEHCNREMHEQWIALATRRTVGKVVYELTKAKMDGAWYIKRVGRRWEARIDVD